MEFRACFVGSSIRVPSLNDEIGTVLWFENALIVLWWLVQLVQINMLQVWQKDMAFASLEQFWQVTLLLLAFFIIWYTSISPLMKNKWEGSWGHRLPQQRHYDTGDTLLPGLFAVALAAVGCTLGSRHVGRPGPWGHGTSPDRWDTGPVSPAAPGSLQESCRRE